ncbi:MAG: carboxy-S-adenosyl-L-methionine synthase CmoA [Pseudomonadales bacterium]|nr:carboxy-S-adenosyl-L-methionine synthase CmoA [Pseudomonadales bacterium]
MKTDQKDKLFSKPIDRIADFAFNQEVVSVFPDMISRSVPGYSTIIAMTGVLARRYATENSHIYDLGCSLGASLFSMQQQITSSNVALIGIDNSKAMIERCQTLLAAQPASGIHCQLLCQRIENSVIENASVVVLNFSLQFIPLEQRQAIISKIHRGMQPGGILVLSEKIRFEDEHLNRLNIELHHEFKKANGYSELEISQKRSALEKVLIPETLDAHRQRLRTAGFANMDVWFQCFNFASIIAIK